MSADFIILSDKIFTGDERGTLDGYVAVKDGRITAVGSGECAAVPAGVKVYDLHGKMVCPGFVDVHCFFTGWLVGHMGADFSGCADEEAATKLAGECSGDVVLGRGLADDIAPFDVDAAVSGRPTVIMYTSGESCVMNAAAEKMFGFTPDSCYSEGYWRLLRHLLRDRDFCLPLFNEYMQLMNSRGVTSVKEMGFDDYYGFTDELERLERESALTLRVSFMSQPVGMPMNLSYGKKMRQRFQGDFVRFSGYNQMTDGSISQHEGYLKEPYDSLPGKVCAKDFDFDAIERDALAADAEGFRFSLHAQGDGAVSRVLDIFEKCRRGADGRVVNRQAVTDLELSDPTDLERMGKLGVVAEVYPQIPSLYDAAEKIKLTDERVGAQRAKYYWNRRKMANSGVVISCGTDLPMLVDDIPESVYCSVFNRFPDGTVFNEQNALTSTELLRAWTAGGQYNLGREDELGTLSEGKLADIAVLDGDIFACTPENVRGIKVCLTIVDGKPAYEKL